MEIGKKFCEKCGQRITEGTKGFLGFGGVKPTKYYEFKDGYYCEACAVVKVEEERKKK